MRFSPAIAIATALMLVLGGCGGAGHRPAAGASPAVKQADQTHEYPSRPPSPQRATAGAPSAIDAIRGFATAYINWSFRTVATRMRGLAQASIGQARSAMALAAAQTANDYELQRGGVSNHGTVEAIAPLTRHRDQYVVVTRELTTAIATTVYQGLRPAWHLAIATVARLPGGQWVLSGWQPES